jgi:hypothetical protein
MLEIVLVSDMRIVPDAPVSGVKSFVSRAQLMCRTRSLWSSMWLPSAARVPLRHVAAHGQSGAGLAVFRPTYLLYKGCDGSLPSPTLPLRPHSPTPALSAAWTFRSAVRRHAQALKLSGEPSRERLAERASPSLSGLRRGTLLLPTDALPCPVAPPGSPPSTHSLVTSDVPSAPSVHRIPAAILRSASRSGSLCLFLLSFLGLVGYLSLLFSRFSLLRRSLQRDKFEETRFYLASELS